MYEVGADDGERLALKWYHDHVASAGATGGDRRAGRARRAQRALPLADRDGERRPAPRLRLRDAAATAALRRAGRPADRQGRRAVPDVCTVGLQLADTLPAPAHPGPLLPRHQLRQRVLRSGDRRPADLRQRQRRHRRRGRAPACHRHQALHGPRDRAARSAARARDRPVLARRCCSSTC